MSFQNQTTKNTFFLLKIFIISLIISVQIPLLISLNIPTNAEGTKQLINSGGYRAYTEGYTGQNVLGIARKTIIYVYAKTGETINLGSSAAGIGSGTINTTSPTGTASSCGSTGLISNRTQEVAGPLPNSGGFTPCTITVASGQEGVWKIDFVSPSPATSSNPPTTLVGNNWTQPNNVSYISAWDVTIRNSGGSEITGRAFSNFLAMTMGANSIGLSSLLHVQTKDGYTYKIDLNNIDPWVFNLFSNNKGIVNNATGTQFYKSLELLYDTFGNFNLPNGYTLHKPDQPDTTTDFTNKIFFEQPASDLPVSTPSAGGTVWLKNTPQTPATITNFNFTGVDGTPSQAGTSPLGGNFTFTSDRVGEADITLDLNQNGVYGDGNDKVITKILTTGSNQIFWDGKDGNGIKVPAGTQTYNANIVSKVGEVHFSFIDAENNPNGIIITRLSDNNSTVYFNDANLGGVDARAGVDSAGGTHSWTNSFGDIRLIDTWSVVKSAPVSLQNSITLREADLSITKTHSPNNLRWGDTITYTVTVTNSSTSPNHSPLSRVVDNVDPIISNVNWTCAITNNASGSGTNNCGANSGSGNNLDTTVSLNPGAVATFTITGQLPSIPAPELLSEFGLINSVSVSRGVDTTDPNTNNNNAYDFADLTEAADISLTKNSCTTLVSGENCNYTLVGTNNGPTRVNSITITDTLPSGLTYVSFSDPNNEGWTCSASGQTVTCTNNNPIPDGASKTVVLTVRFN